MPNAARLTDYLCRLAQILAFAALFGVSSAVADDENAPPASAFEQGGIRIGSFLIDPAISVAELYDSNIFATESNEQDDLITIVSPSFTLESDWEEHRIKFEGGADIARYTDNSDEDYEDYWVATEGRYDLSETGNVFAGARFSQDHEDRVSPDDVSGESPTIFRKVQGHAGIFQRFGKVFARAGGTAQRLDFDDVSGTAATINNDDRDRNQFQAGARVGYLLSPTFQPFIQTSFEARRYDADRDDNGFDRDSRGFNAALGSKFAIGDNAQVEIFAGYLSQAYEDSALPTVEAFDFGARLVVEVDSATNLTGFVDRSVEETTLAGAAAALETVVGLNLEHAIAPNLIADGRLLYLDSDFQGTSREDNLYSVGAGLRFFLAPNVYVGGDYRYLALDSSAPGESYVDHQLFLRLGLQGSRAYEPNGATAGGPSGFYIGAQGGHGVLETGLEGPRGSDGTLSAGFGGTGATAGGFGGYDHRLGRWRLGAELEGEASNATWDHERSGGGRVFSTTKDWTAGLAARIGYALDHGATFYGRVGPVVTLFDTDYQRGGQSLSQDDRKAGVRFGGGLEAPVSDRIFWRMDFTHTLYSSYSVDPGSGADTFDNSESLVRVGLGYRFYDPVPVQPDIAPARFSGFYAGVQGGLGNLLTENVGPRETGQGAAISQLTAERSGSGPEGGLFAGYGQTFDAFYLGLELEGEVSGTEAEVDREPNGRKFTVAKDWGFGGALRAGYVLGDAALVYGRVGAVRTTFQTDYAVGANQIEQDDALTGLRVGGGVEAPISDTFFVRLDYTYTDYGDHSVAYGSGTDSFDSTESLFRLGLGVRF